MKIPFSLLLFLSSQVAFAQTSGQGGAIALDGNATPATDLIYQGKAISASEANTLSQKGIDLSTLNPSEKQDLWKNIFVDNKAIQDASLPYQEISFKDYVLAPDGKIRFLGGLANGTVLNFATSKNVHTQFIRRNLLVKIGYRVPNLTYVPKIKLVFQSSIDKELFEQTLSDDTLGDTKRWIESETDTSIVINDLVAQETNLPIFDLSLGTLASSDGSDLIQGQRVLNSLEALYSLTDFDESANLFSWSTGQVQNNSLLLPFDGEDSFYPSLDDVKWMALRIAQLSRDDWQDVVSKSYLPDGVAALIVEKLISRREDLLRLTKLDKKIPQIKPKYDTKVSLGKDLVKGEIKQEKYPGYASRFSYGDPENPLNFQQVLFDGSSQLIGTALNVLVSEFNKLPFLSTDVADKVTARQSQNFITEVNHYLKTGTYRPVPLGVYTIPTYHGGLIASRDVVSGNYMGTDNLFQLVDNIGISVGGGAYLMTEGLDGIPLKLFQKLPISGGVSATASYNRIYSHIKPLTSMKAALKYPLYNLFVPLAQMTVGKKLKKVATANLSQLTDSEQTDLITKLKNTLNGKMTAGDNFIITDTLGADMSGEFSATLYEMITGRISAAVDQQVISRINILKVSDTEYQVYRDLGYPTSFSAGLDIDAYIPVLKLNYGLLKGQSKTDYYDIKLDSNANPVTDATEKSKYLALADLFLKGNLTKIKKLGEPMKFRYKLGQDDGQENLLVVAATQVKSSMSMRAIPPTGDELDLYRKYKASSEGLNYADLAPNVLSALVSILTKTNFSVGSGYDGGGNAGFSVFGLAKTKTEAFESPADFLGNKNYAPIVKLSRIRNGWSIKKKGAQRIIDGLQKRYNYEFFQKDVLADTKNIFMYGITANFMFYSGAIEHLLAIKDDEIDTIFDNERKKHLAFSEVHRLRIKGLIHQLQKAKKLGDISDLTNDIFNQVEESFTLDGMAKICGGQKNLYVYAQINGFRTRDENGDQPIPSSSFGEFGNKMVSGPFDYLQSMTGIASGELNASWLLRKLY